tara:strand:- start:550 stop:1458 length:909 start_codon:yes stop_codon:yes gene_type:complete
MNDLNSCEDNILLLGRGFALNVYLPALIKINCQNILIESSAKKFRNPSQIKNDLKWIDKDEIRNKRFTKIIIAVPPEEQYDLICKEELWKNSDNLILEKPIANNYKNAICVINTLIDNKIKYSINYIFRYTKWFHRICKYLENNINQEEIRIVWKFKSRHIQKKEGSWKNNHIEGGGSIRFYGIHLIAILSDIGYVEVEKTTILNQSKEKLISWSCELRPTKRLPKLTLYIDSFSNINQFHWYQKDKNILELESPFSLEINEYRNDNRIPPTINFLKEKHTNILHLKNICALELWNKIEQKL